MYNTKLNRWSFNFQDSSGHAAAAQEVNLDDQSNDPMDESNSFPDLDFSNPRHTFDATISRRRQSVELPPPLPHSSDQQILPPPPPPPEDEDEDSRSNSVIEPSKKGKNKSAQLPQ